VPSAPVTMQRREVRVGGREVDGVARSWGGAARGPVTGAGCVPLKHTHRQAGLCGSIAVGSTMLLHARAYGGTSHGWADGHKTFSAGLLPRHVNRRACA
jgi:hypothetical protein